MEGDDINNLLPLLYNVMSSNEHVKLKSREELNNTYSDAESTVQLCSVLSNAQSMMQLRRCAAHELKSRLGDRASWQQLKERHQMEIQSEMFAALNSLRPDDKPTLQADVVRSVGYVMAQPGSADWNELIFHHIKAQCTSANAETQAFGALLFKFLAKTSPKMLEKNLDHAQQIFTAAMQTAKEQGDLATPAMDHLLAGWTLTIPLFRPDSVLRKELVFTLPTILCITKELAYKSDPEQKCHGFNVINRLNKYLPELVLPHLKLVMEDLFVLATDSSVGNCHRVEAIECIKNCVRSMRRQIIRLRLMDKLLMTLYTLLAVEPAMDANGEELYLKQPEEEHSTLEEAVQTLQFVAAHTDTNRVAMRTLRLLQPQMEQTDSALQRLAVQLFLAQMAQGFTDLLSTQPLDRFLDLVNRGFHDPDVMVQHGAHYALTIMAENLQPEITRLVPVVLPLFNKFFDELTPAQRLANVESEANNRMFCALEIYCESVRKEVLHLYLDDLMQRLLLLAQPQSNSLILRQLALSCIRCLAKTSMDYFKPYYDAVIGIIMPLLQHAPNEGQLLLRTYAIQAINSLSVVDNAKFGQQAPQFMGCCMEIMTQMSGAQIFSFELLGVLAGFVPTQIVEHLPEIMNALMTSIKQTGQALKAGAGAVESAETADTAESSDSKSDTDTVEDAGDANDTDEDDLDGIDGDTADESDEGDEDNELKSSIGDSEGDPEQVETRGPVSGEATEELEDGHGDQRVQGSERSSSSYESRDLMGGHEEALVCLKAFAIHLSSALMPYMPSLLDMVGTAAEQLHAMDKWSAYETLTQLLVLQWQHGDKRSAKQVCIDKLPAMIYFVQTSKETFNVVNMMNCIRLLLMHLKSEALESEGYADMIFSMISRALRRKLACQFDIGVETETESFEEWSQALYTENQVMEAASELLPIFGHALRKRQFASYFQMISSRFVKSLRHAQMNGQVSRTRFFLYNLTARCMEPLGVLAEQYYEILCYSIVDCILDEKQCVRHFALELFHWLLPNAIEREHTEIIIRSICPVFCESLSSDSPLTLDEREDVCGILASMICADCQSVNLKEVLPCLFNQVPLQRNLDAYVQLVRALRYIYREQKDMPTDHVAKAVQTLLEFLDSQQLKAVQYEEARTAANDFLELIKMEHPEIYTAVIQPATPSLPKAEEAQAATETESEAEAVSEAKAVIEHEHDDVD